MCTEFGQFVKYRPGIDQTVLFMPINAIIHSKIMSFINLHWRIFFFFSPVSHKVNVPVGVDNDAQDISDLLGALLHGHVVLSQDHAVHITGPGRHNVFLEVPLVDPLESHSGTNMSYS